MVSGCATTVSRALNGVMRISATFFYWMFVDVSCTGAVVLLSTLESKSVHWAWKTFSKAKQTIILSPYSALKNSDTNGRRLLTYTVLIGDFLPPLFVTPLGLKNLPAGWNYFLSLGLPRVSPVQVLRK